MNFVLFNKFYLLFFFSCLILNWAIDVDSLFFLRRGDSFSFSLFKECCAFSTPQAEKFEGLILTMVSRIRLEFPFVKTCFLFQSIVYFFCKIWNSSRAHLTPFWHASHPFFACGRFEFEALFTPPLLHAAASRPCSHLFFQIRPLPGPVHTSFPHSKRFSALGSLAKKKTIISARHRRRKSIWDSTVAAVAR